MKSILIGIFAHPDDEAFGPAGTLFKLKAEGYDIHLILLTNGEAGTNPDNVADLGTTRLEEWRLATDLLGATSTHALHYPDGALETIAESELDEAAKTIIKSIVDAYDQPPVVSYMTFEPNGLTGHRDHIAASQLATRMSARFSAHETWYFCLDSTQAPLEGTRYYEPRARDDDYITNRVDVSVYLEQKHAMMDAHFSQRADAAMMKALGSERSSIESFHVN